MVSRILFLPEADDTTSQAMLTTENTIMAFHAMLNPETDKITYQDQLAPEADDAASQAWFLPLEQVHFKDNA